MRTRLQKIKTQLAQFAIIRKIYFSLMWLYKYPFFIRDYVIFKKRSSPGKRFSIKLSDIFPQLLDNTSKTHFDPHYTYHPAWAARIVASLKPTKHIDISSILHFSTLVSAFIPVEFYDYRPAEVRLDNLQCKKGDLTALPFADNSVESISCMHTIEHVGLGRYGDPIDPDGDIKAINELMRIVKPGGTLIFVTPVGKPKIAYNAHRIYSYEQVIGMFPEMNLQEFSLVPDDFKTHGLIKNADKDMVKDQSYACGCFWFIKK
jgi:SAM-dependent methyltransferase